MATKTVTLRGLEAAIRRDLNRTERDIAKAVQHAAKMSVPGVRARTPKAFGDLRDSTHAETSTNPSNPAKLVVSAPHAAAVEVGSRPHVVPIDELIAWVKLRGMQGLTRGGRQRSSSKGAATYDKTHGPTTREMARHVATELNKLEKGGALDVDAPEQIARAIQAAIAQSGTRPHHYVEGSIHTVILPDLDAQIKFALHD